MPSYDKNLYYAPEKSGYETVDSYDTGASYEFNITMVLKKDGKLFYAQDSGCSCPIPFEDIEESDLTPLTDFDAFKREVKDYHAWNSNAAEESKFLKTVREALEAT